MRKHSGLFKNKIENKKSYQNILLNTVSRRSLETVLQYDSI